MKNVIITGATGSVGVSLVERLLKEKINVTVISRKNGRTANLPESDLLSVVYSELDELNKIELSEKFDVFYHLAWMGTTGAKRDDTELQTKNIRYTLDAVNLASRLGCDKFIGAGSQAEYGLCDKPLTPDTPAFPFSGYGTAKLAAGQLSRLKCNQLNINHTWVRILSVFGKYDSEKSIIKYAVNNFRKNKDALFSESTQIWDFLFSDDAAEALFLIGNSENTNGKTYVLGSGTGKPLKEYIKEIYSLCDSTSEIHFGAVPFSQNSVMFLKADITALHKDVGFEPKTDFKTGIKKIIESEEQYEKNQYYDSVL